MSGTDRTQPPVTGGPRVILIEPQLGENIGAAARAMLNCGLIDLALVNPREGWPNQKAQVMASGATEVLDKARVFDTVEDAVAGLTRVYATTARPRDMTVRVTTPRHAAAELRTAWQAGEGLGILFGPERSGMTNEHIALADTVISVPLNPAYQSLNLAQAVLIVGYEWFAAASDAPAEQLVETGTRAADKEELLAFFERFEAALDQGGFFRSPDMRPSMVLNLRAMLQRANLTEQEVRTLHGVVSCLTGSWRDTDNQRRRHALRRVVTGHDPEGKSMIALDDQPAASASASGGTADPRDPTEIWATLSAETAADSATSEFRVVDLPPGSRREMHRTDTVDYGIVLAGEVHLVLEREETVLRSGDVVVQRGTSHAWHNRAGRPARLAFINLGGQVTDEGRCPEV